MGTGMLEPSIANGGDGIVGGWTFIWFQCGFAVAWRLWHLVEDQRVISSNI